MGEAEEAGEAAVVAQAAQGRRDLGLSDDEGSDDLGFSGEEGGVASAKRPAKGKAKRASTLSVMSEASNSQC